MPRYAVCFSKTGADSVRQIVEIVYSGGSPTRQLVDFFSVGCVTTPADAFFKYTVRRVTSSAGGDAFDQIALDPSDATSFRCTVKHRMTADASSFNTAPVEVFRAPCHHRAVCIFAAADGQELVGAAINANGISLGLADVSTNLFEGTVIYKE